MRTKTILLAAAIFAAGLGVSLAQSPVYSVNAVGYVTIQLTNGYNLCSNPLNGTNNQVNTIMPVTPEDSFILRWDSGAQSFGDPIFYIGGNWEPNVTINPGEGFFLYCYDYSVPVGTKAPLTFVGEVPQGNVVNTNIGTGYYNLVSHSVPQAIALDAPGVNFPAHEDDYVFLWGQGAQSYGDQIFYIGGAWTSPVVPDVGGAFFLGSDGPLGARTWTRSFSVN